MDFHPFNLISIGIQSQKQEELVFILDLFFKRKTLILLRLLPSVRLF